MSTSHIYKKNLTRRGFTPLEVQPTPRPDDSFSANSPAAQFCESRQPVVKLLTGFTLTELLVVLTIIGLLITVALASLSSAKARARDSRRAGEVNTLSKALALYLSIRDEYPQTGGNFPGTIIDGNDTVSNDLATISILQGKLIDPTDGQVIGGETFHYYYFSLDGNEYTITYCLETNSILGQSPGCGNTLTGKERD